MPNGANMDALNVNLAMLAMVWPIGKKVEVVDVCAITKGGRHEHLSSHGRTLLLV